jgi:hypothetical protein
MVVMKDMFVNYDNPTTIRKHHHKPIPAETKILESLDNISIIKNAMGNEIGVRVKWGTAFNLYLYLDGWVEDSTIDALVSECELKVKVIDGRHKVALEKTLNAIDVYEPIGSYLTINFTQEEAKLLAIDSYKMCITLSYPDGEYELFSESDGLLIVR